MVAQQEQKVIAEISAKFLSHVTIENGVYKINAEDMHYKELNALLRELDSRGAAKVELSNVYGTKASATEPP